MLKVHPMGWVPSLNKKESELSTDSNSLLAEPTATVVFPMIDIYPQTASANKSFLELLLSSICVCAHHVFKERKGFLTGRE